jgi:hypothetical protein
MSWQVLRPELGTLLRTLTTLQEVSNSPKVMFSGYPAAHIVPSENSGDYETTKENVRTYAFAVRIFYETKQTSIENALLALEQIVDSVIDLFDQEDLKGSDTRTVGVDLPSNYTFINIWASPSRWGELPGEQLIMAEIIIKVRVSIDLT